MYDWITLLYTWNIVGQLYFNKIYILKGKKFKMYYVRKRYKRYTSECLQWLSMNMLQNFYLICIFWHFPSFLLSAYITFIISKIINNYTYREECAESLKKKWIFFWSPQHSSVYLNSAILVEIFCQLTLNLSFFHAAHLYPDQWSLKLQWKGVKY